MSTVNGSARIVWTRMMPNFEPTRPADCIIM
jgi:hypothetical protein